MDATYFVFDHNSALYDLFFHNPHFWADVGWWIDKIGTPISIITAIGLFLSQQTSDLKKRKEDEKERICRVSNVILNVIKAQIKLFDDSKLISMRFISISLSEGNNEIYDIGLLDTSSYDSIINSGLFTHFNLNIQTYLSNLYANIKDRNELFKNFIDMPISHIPTDSTLSINDKLEFYRISINLLNSKIIILLNTVKILLEKKSS